MQGLYPVYQTKFVGGVLAYRTIDDHLQTYQFFDKTLPDFITTKHHITPQYQARLEAAKLAIKDFVAYVESLRLI